MVSEPRSWTFLETASLHHFVYRHVVQRADTVQMLAVRHGCDVTALKRLNNLFSDHSLQSRMEVFLPAPSSAALLGQHVEFRYCRACCRDLCVVVASEEAERLREAQKGQAAGAGAAAADKLKDPALALKLCELLARSLHVDSATAMYYLKEAAGDLKAAMAMCEHDLSWECSTRRIRRGRIPRAPSGK